MASNHVRPTQPAGEVLFAGPVPPIRYRDGIVTVRPLDPRDIDRDLEPWLIVVVVHPADRCPRGDDARSRRRLLRPGTEPTPNLAVATGDHGFPVAGLERAKGDDTVGHGRPGHRPSRVGIFGSRGGATWGDHVTDTEYLESTS